MRYLYVNEFSGSDKPLGHSQAYQSGAWKGGRIRSAPMRIGLCCVDDLEYLGLRTRVGRVAFYNAAAEDRAATNGSTKTNPLINDWTNDPTSDPEEAGRRRRGSLLLRQISMGLV